MNGKQDETGLKGHLKYIGHYLIALSDGGDRPEGESLNEIKYKFQRRQDDADDLPRLRAIALEEYRNRRSRVKFIRSNLFGEPGWDILLDLFVARIDGKRISITSACAASDCPPTTSLRWISVLEGEGMVIREDDILDGRRSWVTISDSGMKCMVEYLRNKVNESLIRRVVADIINI